MGYLFFRYCEKCQGKFHPETKHQKLCNKCRREIRNVNFIKMINFRFGVKQ
jgi:Zn finger protein HypA/HybF involved in hydrogenase expression